MFTDFLMFCSNTLETVAILTIIIIIMTIIFKDTSTRLNFVQNTITYDICY